MSKKESYISVQSDILKKYDLVKKLGIKAVPERGRLFKVLAKLRKDKKITSKDTAIEQLKDVEKWVGSHLDELKKLYEKEK